jgi:hypothetical protein
VFTRDPSVVDRRGDGLAVARDRGHCARSRVRPRRPCQPGRPGERPRPWRFDRDPSRSGCVRGGTTPSRAWPSEPAIIDHRLRLKLTVPAGKIERGGFEIAYER